jgi:hypothetical protein
VSGRTVAILGVAGWFVAACVGGLQGIFATGQPLALLPFILLPIAGFLLAYFLSPSLRAFADEISLTLLVGSHLWRFVGLGFVIGWLQGALPAGFGIPEGFGDIIAALGVLLLLPSIRRGTVSPGWLLAWNIWGLLDLLSAITVGILYSNSPLGVLSRGGLTTQPMTVFPVSLIPTFFVPLFILLHVLTFKRIATLKRTGS